MLSRIPIEIRHALIILPIFRCARQNVVIRQRNTGPQRKWLRVKLNPLKRTERGGHGEACGNARIRIKSKAGAVE